MLKYLFVRVIFFVLKDISKLMKGGGLFFLNICNMFYFFKELLVVVLKCDKSIYFDINLLRFFCYV